MHPSVSKSDAPSPCWLPLLLAVGPLVGSDAELESFFESPARPVIASADHEVYALADWLATELSLDAQQQARVVEILERDRLLQSTALALGLPVELDPPPLEEPEEYVPRSGLRTADAVLREVDRAAATRARIAESKSWTQLHPRLCGWRSTTLAGVWRLLDAEQAARYRELLGTQGSQWLRSRAFPKKQRAGRRGGARKGAGKPSRGRAKRNSKRKPSGAQKQAAARKRALAGKRAAQNRQRQAAKRSAASKRRAQSRRRR